MKRVSKYRQTKPRMTCLAEYVHRLNDPFASKEFQRQILKAHHGTWSAPIPLDVMIERLKTASEQ